MSDLNLLENLEKINSDLDKASENLEAQFAKASTSSVAIGIVEQGVKFAEANLNGLEQMLAQMSKSLNL